VKPKSLNHPHIGAIYGLDEANGAQFLVLELVDGESLDKRIARDRIPIDEALEIARQIAEALEAAHQKGIIHRDLKPANIALTKDGNVKVLDFGLAKALEPPLGTAVDRTVSPTITSPAMTRMGVILGTAAYMSPEQAKGKPADKRSDVWAFGCVLYEMLTGKRAFDGEDITETLANVLTLEPRWDVLPSTVPEHIRLLLRRCLEKDRTRHVSDASIARFLLTESGFAASPALTSSATTILTTPSLWRRAIPIAITTLVVAAVAAAIGRSIWPAPSAPVMRLMIQLPEGRRFAARSQVLTISPDGSRVVFADASGQLYMRSMVDTEAHAISGTGQDVMSPFFSPDGQWIGFFSFQDLTLKKIAATGGAPVAICKMITGPHGIKWDGDWIVFADEGEKGILRVSANGGEPEVVAAVRPGQVFAAPQLLDDGRIVLFTVAGVQGSNRWDGAEIVVQPIGSTDRKVLVHGGSEGYYVPSGHLVYMVGRCSPYLLIAGRCKWGAARFQSSRA
jgi:serine/threonine-protein kinase